MRHLPPRMHPLVGPPTAMQFGRFTGDLLQSVLDEFLYGRAVGLNLPAGIIGSVVADVESVALHGYSGV